MTERIDYDRRSPDPEDEGGLFGDEGDDNDGRILSDDEGAQANPANSGDEEDKKKKRKAATKRTGPVRRMLISEDILSGKNGLTKVEEIFKDFQFRGKGKEKEDLNRMLNKFEHWIHTMHPKHPFDQSLERIEFLGLKKKPVKTLVKRIRMGLVSYFDDDDDKIIDDDDEIEGANAPEEDGRGVEEGAFASEDELDTQMMDELEFGIGATETQNQNANHQDDVPNLDEQLEFEEAAVATENHREEIMDDEMDNIIMETEKAGENTSVAALDERNFVEAAVATEIRRDEIMGEEQDNIITEKAGESPTDPNLNELESERAAVATENRTDEIMDQEQEDNIITEEAGESPTNPNLYELESEEAAVATENRKDEIENINMETEKAK